MAACARSTTPASLARLLVVVLRCDRSRALLRVAAARPRAQPGLASSASALFRVADGGGSQPYLLASVSWPYDDDSGLLH
jgi:hypothetical protein